MSYGASERLIGPCTSRQYRPGSAGCANPGAEARGHSSSAGSVFKYPPQVGPVEFLREPQPRHRVGETLGQSSAARASGKNVACLPLPRLYDLQGTSFSNVKRCARPALRPFRLPLSASLEEPAPLVSASSTRTWLNGPPIVFRRRAEKGDRRAASGPFVWDLPWGPRDSCWRQGYTLSAASAIAGPASAVLGGPPSALSSTSTVFGRRPTPRLHRRVVGARARRRHGLAVVSTAFDAALADRVVVLDSAGRFILPPHSHRPWISPNSLSRLRSQASSAEDVSRRERHRSSRFVLSRRRVEEIDEFSALVVRRLRLRSRPPCSPLALPYRWPIALAAFLIVVLLGRLPGASLPVSCWHRSGNTTRRTGTSHPRLVGRRAPSLLIVKLRSDYLFMRLSGSKIGANNPVRPAQDAFRPRAAAVPFVL